MCNRTKIIVEVLWPEGLATDDSMLVWGDTFPVGTEQLSEVFFLPFIAVLTGSATATHYANKQR